jgi:hypothetical protein
MPAGQRTHVVLACRSPYDSSTITGIAGCCARDASGHAAAAPPSSATNSRRPMPDMGAPSLRDYRTSAYRRRPPVELISEACRVLAHVLVLRGYRLTVLSGERQYSPMQVPEALVLRWGRRTQ